MNDVVVSAHGLSKQYRIWTKAKPQSVSDRLALTLHRRRRREPTRSRCGGISGLSAT